MKNVMMRVGGTGACQRAPVDRLRACARSWGRVSVSVGVSARERAFLVFLLPFIKGNLNLVARPLRHNSLFVHAPCT